MSRLDALVGGHVTAREGRAALACRPPTEADNPIAIAMRALTPANRFMSPHPYAVHGLNHPRPALT